MSKIILLSCDDDEYKMTGMRQYDENCATNYAIINGGKNVIEERP